MTTPKPKTTPATKKTTTVAKSKSKAATAQQVSSAPTLDPKQALKDLTAIFAKAAKAAPKAG